ncbi:MAG: RNA methyltransferase [Brumimicrobium sp.]
MVEKDIEIKLLQALYQIITPEKVEKFERIAAERTRYITIAVENIFQEHNASAVIRSCDCFGIQDVHIIEKNNRFTLNRDIALGAGQWINHYHYTDPLFPTAKCIQELKNQGYKIAATTPHTDAFTINDVPIDRPLAILFGTEQTGLSEKALEMADYYVKIPMVGFTESFNISVSAALTMNTIRTRLESQTEFDWKLTEEQQTQLKIEWCKNVIRNPDAVINGLIKRIKEV